MSKQWSPPPRPRLRPGQRPMPADQPMPRLNLPQQRTELPPEPPPSPHRTRPPAGGHTRRLPFALRNGLTLTERELAVLSKASSGASNAEIAAEMYLSEDTIKTHLARTYRKLGATTRVGAVVIAMRQGLLLCACERNAR